MTQRVGASSVSYHGYTTPFVRMGLGVISDILVRGKRVIPARASEPGYRFRFPVLDSALHDLLGRPDNESVAAR